MADWVVFPLVLSASNVSIKINIKQKSGKTESTL